MKKLLIAASILITVAPTVYCMSLPWSSEEPPVQKTAEELRVEAAETRFSALVLAISTDIVYKESRIEVLKERWLTSDKITRNNDNTKRNAIESELEQIGLCMSSPTCEFEIKPVFKQERN